jgi:hypothetical protein
VLLVTALPISVVASLPGSTPSGTAVVTQSYDVRGINLTDNDMALAVFSYPAGGTTTPVLEFFDTTVNAFVPVQGSTLLPGTPFVDSAAHQIDVVLDRTSLPKLSGLTGTVFTVSVELPPPAPAASGIQPDAALLVHTVSVLTGDANGVGLAGQASPVLLSEALPQTIELVTGSTASGGGDAPSPAEADPRGVLADLPLPTPLNRSNAAASGAATLSPSRSTLDTLSDEPQPAPKRPSPITPQPRPTAPPDGGARAPVDLNRDECVQQDHGRRNVAALDLAFAVFRADSITRQVRGEGARRLDRWLGAGLAVLGAASPPLRPARRRLKR